MTADLGLHHVEGHVLRCGFTLQRIHSDYGYDYVMWTYNERGEIESGFAYFQMRNRLNQWSIQKIGHWKHEIDQQLSGKVQHHV